MAKSTSESTRLSSTRERARARARQNVHVAVVICDMFWRVVLESLLAHTVRVAHECRDALLESRALSLSVCSPALPPGFLPHSLPPQVPQLFAQHAIFFSLPWSSSIPPAFAHCAAAGGTGPGGGGGDGDGDGDGDGGGDGGSGGWAESDGSRNPPPFICMMAQPTRLTSVSDVGPTHTHVQPMCTDNDTIDVSIDASIDASIDVSVRKSMCVEK